MKRSKRVISIILSIVMVVGLCAGLDFSAYAVSSSGWCGNSVRYTFDSTTGELDISGTGAMTNYASASSPFSNASEIKKIIINNGVTSISDYAFYNCRGIKELTMPASTKIYNSSNSFYNCTNIEKVTLTKGTGTMQDYGTSTSSSSSYTYCRYTPWYISRNSIKELVIEDGVNNIGDYAFYGCTGLTSVTIPDSVTSIGSYAFYDCAGLKELTMPASAKIHNSSYTFGYCTNIEKVTLTKGTGTMQNYSWSSSNPDTCYEYTPWYISRNSIKELVIEDGIENIGDYAFEDCTGLTSVTIGNGVTSIGDSAFYGCTGLTSVTIGNGVTSIGRSAFDECTGLTSVTIPDSVNSIGFYAFKNCTGIKELTMPASAKIYNFWYTFGNCTNIEKVTLTKGTGTMQDYSYNYDDSDTFYWYTPWYESRENIKEIVIEDGVNNIGDYAFSDCTGLTSVTIPNSVTSIGYGAFNNCTGLTSVTIGNSVTSIGEVAFNYCTGLTSVTIPDNVTSIGDWAFRDCKGLTSVTIPNSVTSIGNFAFGGCDSLTSVTIGNSVTSIGEDAFYNCTRLKNITIPKSVTIIGDYAFSGIDERPYVFYSSSKSDWNKIKIGAENYLLFDAYMHYNNTKHEMVYNKTKATLSKNGVIQNSCKGCGKRSGSKTIIYYPKTITLSATKYTFDGKVKKPSVKVVGSDGKAISSSNYTVTYPSGRMAPGKYNVKITFNGNYSGSVTKQFSIVQKATSLSSVTSPAKGKMKISWKKVAGVSGYNIQMSTSKSFSASKTADVNFGPSKTSATGKATSKKKYYVRIRTYKTVKGKNYYSNWSSVKTVTIR